MKQIVSVITAISLACVSNLVAFVAVDSVLRDLLPPGVYFRFNPTLSENIALDENRVEKLDMMQRDTVTYLESNRIELEKAAARLLLPRQRRQKAWDWLQRRKAMYTY